MVKHHLSVSVGDNRLIRDELINWIEVANRSRFGVDRQRDPWDGITFAVHELQPVFNIGKPTIPNDLEPRYERNSRRKAQDAQETTQSDSRRAVHRITPSTLPLARF